MNEKKAEALEQAGLWRRAARCWLDVMDASQDDKERERIALRRNHCISMSIGVTADQRRYQNKQRYREQKSGVGY
ncbi:PerC family transcriptional regulator [Rahnella sp. ChDrAdgB13]|uniref:PerC family transcriptional regulator n=1 Tax=Rahnella sp. ChDrAdgB13 TaxID=1850581 RepID=UPI001AD89EA8|nr:PerC family transcriptional regulator [Rahnella sp. ChDrAdgB13]